jgi:hypothetical protein
LHGCVSGTVAPEDDFGVKSLILKKEEQLAKVRNKSVLLVI